MDDIRLRCNKLYEASGFDQYNIQSNFINIDMLDEMSHVRIADELFRKNKYRSG